MTNYIDKIKKKKEKKKTIFKKYIKDNIEIADVFHTWDDDFVIYFGEKGDEFNK